MGLLTTSPTIKGSPVVGTIQNHGMFEEGINDGTASHQEQKLSLGLLLPQAWIPPGSPKQTGEQQERSPTRNGILTPGR